MSEEIIFFPKVSTGHANKLNQVNYEVIKNISDFVHNDKTKTKALIIRTQYLNGFFDNHYHVFIFLFQYYNRIINYSIPKKPIAFVKITREDLLNEEDSMQSLYFKFANGNNKVSLSQLLKPLGIFDYLHKNKEYDPSTYEFITQIGNYYSDKGFINIKQFIRKINYNNIKKANVEDFLNCNYINITDINKNELSKFIKLKDKIDDLNKKVILYLDCNEFTLNTVTEEVKDRLKSLLRLDVPKIIIDSKEFKYKDLLVKNKEIKYWDVSLFEYGDKNNSLYFYNQSNIDIFYNLHFIEKLKKKLISFKDNLDITNFYYLNYLLKKIKMEIILKEFGFFYHIELFNEDNLNMIIQEISVDDENEYYKLHASLKNIKYDIVNSVDKWVHEFHSWMKNNSKIKKIAIYSPENIKHINMDDIKNQIQEKFNNEIEIIDFKKNEPYELNADSTVILSFGLDKFIYSYLKKLNIFSLIDFYNLRIIKKMNLINAKFNNLSMENLELLKNYNIKPFEIDETIFQDKKECLILCVNTKEEINVTSGKTLMCLNSKTNRFFPMKIKDINIVEKFKTYSIEDKDQVFADWKLYYDSKNKEKQVNIKNKIKEYFKKFETNKTYGDICSLIQNEFIKQNYNKYSSRYVQINIANVKNWFTDETRMPQDKHVFYSLATVVGLKGVDYLWEAISIVNRKACQKGREDREIMNQSIAALNPNNHKDKEFIEKLKKYCQTYQIKGSVDE